MATDWSDLPNDLLSLILQRLPIKDCILSGSVCTSWHSGLAENIRLLPNQGPWLMLPGDRGPQSETRNFYCLSDGNICKINLPEIRGRPCVGSGYRWLIYADEDLGLHVLNPLTRVQFTLPSITALCSVAQIMRHERGGTVVATSLPNVKVIISADPSTDTCTAVIINSFMNKLAFAKLGDKSSWTWLDTQPFYHFDDAICHKGRLYAVNRSGNVVTCDLTSIDPCSPKVIELLPQVPHHSWGHCYLVELSGEILLVWRDVFFNVMDHKRDWFFPMRRANVFRVLKLDPCSNEWMEVESLGDYSLFLGDNQSMAFSSQEFPKLGKNCIYEHQALQQNPPHEGHDYGIYRLEDGCYEIYHTRDVQLCWQPPIWIVPNFF